MGTGFSRTTMTEAFIYDHVRSPRGRGKTNGSLHAITPMNLCSQVLAGLRHRNELDTRLLDDVIFGCVTPVGEQGANVARVAALNADYAQTVPGKQLNRFCASGLEAVNTAAAQVMSGQSDAAIGGGVECMSRVPMGTDGGAMATDPQTAYKVYFVPQGIGADLIATKYGFSRTDLDTYALESQVRADNAWKNGYFGKSILPIRNHIGEIVLDHDEHMRPDSSMESLSSLKPAFTIPCDQGGFDAVALQRYPEVEFIAHRHTAANSSGIVDGAAAVLVGSAAAGKRMGLKPRARIRAFASIGTEPTIMLTGPAPASLKALRRAGMSPADIDLWELNEAFAAVVLLYMETLNIPHDKINVNGGAIAMGHPLGATGAIVLGTLLDELERRDLATGLCTLCIGGGMGTATIIERV
jgi:acetyl-CoA C-acetyltransferase